MSYCRWSSNDFQCDLYCYECIDGTYVTHVAGNRIVFTEPLPPKVVLTQATVTEWYEREQVVLSIVDRSEHRDIGLPEDNKVFVDSTLEEFLETLLRLKGLGYMFPESVIESVKEEIAGGQGDEL